MSNQHSSASESAKLVDISDSVPRLCTPSLISYESSSCCCSVLTTFFLTCRVSSRRQAYLFLIQTCAYCELYVWRLTFLQRVRIARNAERYLEGFCPSVRLSVRPSVTFRYCVQTNEDTIVRFSASGRTIPLISGEVKFIRLFVGDHP